MEMTSTRVVNAPPDRVWAALNDPAVLKDAIPGCESLEQKTDTEWQVVIAAKVGPVAARFNGKKRHSVEISSDPVGVRAESLATFLHHPGELLTYRATSGFLGRTRVAKLRFPEGFIRAVEHHLAAMAAPPERRAAA